MSTPLKRWIALSAVLFIFNAALAQDDLQNLASRLVELRGQVDELQSELDIRREEHKNRMAYLTAQRAELETNRDREQLRSRQLQTEMDELRASQQNAGADSSTLAPVVLDVLARLELQVMEGFPFKTQERLDALGEIKTQLNAGVLPPQRAVNRIWAFIEDEFRISKENAIYSQTIRLGSNDVLADVAKLGTALMFFRTRDNRYGRVIRSGQDWRYQLLEDRDDIAQIQLLFDSLRKQIRQGYFELPNALAAAAEG